MLFPSFTLQFTLECLGPKFNLHQLRQMSAGKHNGCASSEIGYTQVKVIDFEAEEIV